MYNSNNNIIFIKRIVFGENYDEPEYVKSTMTNRPYPHVIKRPLCAITLILLFFFSENQKPKRKKNEKVKTGKDSYPHNSHHIKHNIIIIVYHFKCLRI